MILIVEGQDNTGKTTLIKNLRKYHFRSPRIVTHHSSTPPQDVQDPAEWEYDHYSFLGNLFRRISDIDATDVLLDRFHFGAIVYGTKYRNIDENRIYEIDRHLFANYDNAYLVLLTDNADSIISRDDSLSLEKTKEEYEETRHKFKEVYERSSIKHKIAINITDNGGLGNTFSTVMGFLNGR